MNTTYFIHFTLLTTLLTNSALLVEAKQKERASIPKKSVYELYTPITALDKYGQSTQLRNAMLASSKHGSLILAAIATDDDSDENREGEDGNKKKNQVIVTCTLSKPNPPGLKTSAMNTFMKPSIQVLASTDIYNNNNKKKEMTALMCTGIKPDAQYLSQILREYSRRIWERYDIIPSANRISQSISEVMLNFMDYDVTNKEIYDGVGPVVLKRDDDENGGSGGSRIMGRPFGLHSLVLGIHLESTQEDGDEEEERVAVATIQSVSAAGNVMNTNCFAMGGGKSETINRALLQKYRKYSTVKQIQKLFTDIIKEIVVEEKDNDGVASSSDDFQKNNEEEKRFLNFGIMSCDGITYQRKPL